MDVGTFPYFTNKLSTSPKLDDSDCTEWLGSLSYFHSGTIENMKMCR